MSPVTGLIAATKSSNYGSPDKIQAKNRANGAFIGGEGMTDIKGISQMVEKLLAGKGFWGMGAGGEGPINITSAKGK